MSRAPSDIRLSFNSDQSAVGVRRGVWNGWNTLVVFWLIGTTVILLLGFREIGVGADDYSYVEYFRPGRVTFASLGADFRSNPIGSMFREPVYAIYTIVSSWCFSPESSIRVMVILSLTGLFFAVQSMCKRRIAAVCTLVAMPVVMINYTVHLRQGLALSMLLLGLCLPRRSGRILCGLTPLVHTGLFLIVGTIVADWILQEKVRGTVRKWWGYAIVTLLFCLVGFTWSRVVGYYDYENIRLDYSGEHLVARPITYLGFTLFYLLAGVAFEQPWRDAGFRVAAIGFVTYVVLGMATPFAMRFYECYFAFLVLAMFRMKVRWTWAYIVLCMYIVLAIIAFAATSPEDAGSSNYVLSQALAAPFGR